MVLVNRAQKEVTSVNEIIHASIYKVDFRPKPNPDYFVSYCRLVDSSSELLPTFCDPLKTH